MCVCQLFRTVFSVIHVVTVLRMVNVPKSDRTQHTQSAVALLCTFRLGSIVDY